MAESRSNPKDNSQALLAKLDIQKEVFGALRAEILQILDSERQYLNFNLITLGVGFGSIPLIIEQRAFFVLLIFPIVFHILLWEGLRAVQNIFRLSGYLTDHVIPRVNTILDELSKEKRENVVMGWELQVATRPMSRSELIFASITPTRHWSPILSIASLLIAYLVISNTYGYTPQTGEIWLVLLNLFLLVGAAVRNVQILSIAQKRAENAKAFLAQRALLHQPKQKDTDPKVDKP